MYFFDLVWLGVGLDTLILQIYLLQSQLSVAKELEEFAVLHVFWSLLASLRRSLDTFAAACDDKHSLMCCVTSSQQINIRKHPTHKSCPINSCFFLIWPARPGEASRWPRYQRLNSPSIELERLDPHQSCKGEVWALCVDAYNRDCEINRNMFEPQWHAVRAQTCATLGRRHVDTLTYPDTKVLINDPQIIPDLHLFAWNGNIHSEWAALLPDISLKSSNEIQPSTEKPGEIADFEINCQECNI